MPSRPFPKEVGQVHHERQPSGQRPPAHHALQRQRRDVAAEEAARGEDQRRHEDGTTGGTSRSLVDEWLNPLGSLKLYTPYIFLIFFGGEGGGIVKLNATVFCLGNFEGFTYH